MKRFLVLFLAVLAGAAVADSLDFTRHVVVVTMPGSKSPGTDPGEQAQARARQVLAAAAYDRDYTVGDFLAVHDRQARRLARMRLEYRPGGVRFASDGGSETDYEFPLTGVVLEVLMPVPGLKRLLGRVACPCCGREWPEDRKVPDGVELVPYEDSGAPVFTGLLVDARGLDFRPALFPRVITEAGREVYGPAFAAEEAAVTEGLAGYYRTRNEALLDGRTGSNPLVVRAIRVEGRNPCEAVISDADAARAHGSSRFLEKLARCRVGVLVD